MPKALLNMKSFLPLLLLFILSGCYYDHEETLYPDSCTVPTQATFSVNVLPLLDQRCNSCHSGSSPSGGIVLTNYTEVMKSVNNGKLIGSINRNPGFVPMPKNNAKLSDCQIQTIQLWIDSGAKND